MRQAAGFLRASYLIKLLGSRGCLVEEETVYRRGVFFLPKQ